MDTTQDGLGGTLVPERDISEGFDRLIAANRLFGAELNPTTIKKSGKGALFLSRKLPSRHRIAHPEEFLFPLGKAFLLCAKPWDGQKVI